MNARQAIGFAVSCVGFTLVSTASAQTSYGEVEPNGTKLEAATVHCIHSTDTLVGTTTGTSTTPGSTLLDTADAVRVTACALPLGNYRHRMFITSATPGHMALLCGRNRLDGAIGPNEVAVRTSSSATIPTRFDEWYGFGRSEEVYHRIQACRRRRTRSSSHPTS